MKRRHRHQDAVLIIAEMMWALRRLGAHVFFPEYKLPQAQRFILVGSALGYAQLRGRPLTLASLSRNLEMPPATAVRILEELKLSRWVRKRGKHYLLDLGRLEEIRLCRVLRRSGTTHRDCKEEVIGTEHIQLCGDRPSRHGII
jgi:hypothetical protein